jgi:hypothetical protein
MVNFVFLLYFSSILPVVLRGGSSLKTRVYFITGVYILTYLIGIVFYYSISTFLVFFLFRVGVYTLYSSLIIIKSKS